MQKAERVLLLAKQSRRTEATMLDVTQQYDWIARKPAASIPQQPS
jgi:hypothetical protein